MPLVPANYFPASNCCGRDPSLYKHSRSPSAGLPGIIAMTASLRDDSIPVWIVRPLDAVAQLIPRPEKEIHRPIIPPALTMPRRLHCRPAGATAPGSFRKPARRRAALQAPCLTRLALEHVEMKGLPHTRPGMNASSQPAARGSSRGMPDRPWKTRWSESSDSLLRPGTAAARCPGASGPPHPAMPRLIFDSRRTSYLHRRAASSRPLPERMMSSRQSSMPSQGNQQKRRSARSPSGPCRRC
jgi:hypothetical protein